MEHGGVAINRVRVDVFLLGRGPWEGYGPLPIT